MASTGYLSGLCRHPDNRVQYTVPYGGDAESGGDASPRTPRIVSVVPRARPDHHARNLGAGAGAGGDGACDDYWTVVVAMSFAPLAVERANPEWRQLLTHDVLFDRVPLDCISWTTFSGGETYTKEQAAMDRARLVSVKTDGSASEIITELFGALGGEGGALGMGFTDTDPSGEHWVARVARGGGGRGAFAEVRPFNSCLPGEGLERQSAWRQYYPDLRERIFPGIQDPITFRVPESAGEGGDEPPAPEPLLSIGVMMRQSVPENGKSEAIDPSSLQEIMLNQYKWDRNFWERDKNQISLDYDRYKTRVHATLMLELREEDEIDEDLKERILNWNAKENYFAVEAHGSRAAEVGDAIRDISEEVGPSHLAYLYMVAMYEPELTAARQVQDIGCPLTLIYRPDKLTNATRRVLAGIRPPRSPDSPPLNLVRVHLDRIDQEQLRTLVEIDCFSKIFVKEKRRNFVQRILRRAR